MCSEYKVVNLFKPTVLLLYTALWVLNNFSKFNDFKNLVNNGGKERQMNKT